MVMEDRATSPDIRPAAATPFGYLQWSAVFAGALSAAALAFVLHTFAAAIGIGVSSASPTWRDGSAALWMLSGLYLILVALASYGLGGYVTGRLRQPLTARSSHDVEMRDGMHGLVMWAVATILTGLLAFAALQAATRLAAPSAGGSGPGASVAGENIVAFDIDRLFRSDRPLPGDVSTTRAEAARILLSSSSHRGILPDDRAYLVRLVATRAGVPAAEAERRVEAGITAARENISRARKSTVLLGFMAGAAALLGAVAAALAAAAGGRHRDGDIVAWERWPLPFMRG